jgi:hypothetical protein
MGSTWDIYLSNNVPVETEAAFVEAFLLKGEEHLVMRAVFLVPT